MQFFLPTAAMFFLIFVQLRFRSINYSFKGLPFFHFVSHKISQLNFLLFFHSQNDNEENDREGKSDLSENLDEISGDDELRLTSTDNDENDEDGEDDDDAKKSKAKKKKKEKKKKRKKDKEEKREKRKKRKELESHISLAQRIADRDRGRDHRDRDRDRSRRSSSRDRYKRSSRYA